MQISTRTTNTIVLVTFLLVGLTQSAVLREKADRWRDDDERWAEEMNLVEPPPNPMLLLNHFENPTEKVAPKVGLRTLIKALYQLNAFDDRAAMEDQNDAEIEQLQSENSPKTHFNENLPSNPDEIMEEPESQSSPSSRSQLGENSPINTEETVVSIELSPPEKSEISSSSDNNSFFNTEVPQLNVEMSPTKENDSSSEESTPRSLSILLEDLVDTVHLPTHVESDRTEKFTHSFRYGYGTPFHPRGV